MSSKEKLKNSFRNSPPQSVARCANVCDFSPATISRKDCKKKKAT